MEPGLNRITIARIGAGLAFLCGAIGLLAGLLGRTLKLTPMGWFAGGALLLLIALFVLLDGAIAFQRTRLDRSR